MVEIPFLSLEFIFASIWLAIRSVVWTKQKHIDWKREAVLLLMYINLAVILRFTFFPMSKVDGHIQPLVLDTAAVFPFRVNLLPPVSNVAVIGYLLTSTTPGSCQWGRSAAIRELWENRTTAPRNIKNNFLILIALMLLKDYIISISAERIQPCRPSASSILFHEPT